MDAADSERACAWTRRYVEIIERFDLCPWAAPARARGEVSIVACEESELEAALEQFHADPAAVVALCVLPNFDGDGTQLRRLRARMYERPIASHVAMADFHPDAVLDTGSAARLVPFLRRSPDPMIQAVRHSTLANLRRGSTLVSPEVQAAILAGREVAAVRDVGDQVADANLATVQRDGVALAAALDELITQRRADRNVPAARSR
jgi:hypothetical protein